MAIIIIHNELPVKGIFQKGPCCWPDLGPKLKSQFKFLGKKAV